MKLRRTPLLVLKDLRIMGLGGLDLKPQTKSARGNIRVKPDTNLYNTLSGLLTKYLIFF